MRRFVVLGQKARARPDFLLADIPSTSGRLDVLLHALRAALLVSHGVRRDTTVYLALLGEAAAPRTLRIDGSAARYLRPDERSLATTLKKALSVDCEGASFVEARSGICVAVGGMDVLRSELAGTCLYLLEQQGADIRGLALSEQQDVTFVLGDHLGIGAELRAEWLELGAVPVSVGPTQLHTQDVITLVANELDRRGKSE